MGTSILIAILVIAVIIEAAYAPRLDKVRGQIVVWYGKTHRKYFILL